MGGRVMAFHHTSHMHAVMRSAARLGMAPASLLVLACLCAHAEFDRPHVRIGRRTISAWTGYRADTVKRAMRELRAQGCIVAAPGGERSGTVPTYRILPAPSEIQAPVGDPRWAKLRAAYDGLKGWHWVRSLTFDRIQDGVLHLSASKGMAVQYQHVFRDDLCEVARHIGLDVRSVRVSDAAARCESAA